MRRRVAITGIGAVCSLGKNVKQIWDQLAAGRAGFRELRSLPVENLKNSIGAEVPDYDPLVYFSPQDLPLLDRSSQFALIAAREAIADAGLEANASELAASAALLGIGCGGKETEEQVYQRLFVEGHSRVSPLTIPCGMPSAAVSQLSMHLGITGPVFAVTSACASAGHAIGQAAALIRSGVVETAIAGGTEAPFTLGLMKAWEAMRVLSPSTCRPFCRDRDGLVLGEGAGVVVLEALECAGKRGAKVYAELAGYGMSADAGHITAPSADGAARAMRAALADAMLSADAVGYVNAHGTGTVANDRTETEALHRVFGDHALRMVVSSTKSMHGHALGAAGVLELIAAVLAVDRGLVPPTANFTEAGEGCDLDYVPNQAREIAVRTAVSNSFAFGGLNAVLIVKAFAG